MHVIQKRNDLDRKIAIYEIFYIRDKKRDKKMWISRKRWEAVEKRITDLELQVQSQQEKLEAFRNLWIERQKMRSKASPKHRRD